jgi:hypothetical protein
MEEIEIEEVSINAADKALDELMGILTRFKSNSEQPQKEKERADELYQHIVSALAATHESQRRARSRFGFARFFVPKSEREAVLHSYRSTITNMEALSNMVKKMDKLSDFFNAGPT